MHDALSLPCEVVVNANVAESLLDRLIDDMNRNGFGVIPNYVDAPDLQRMRAFVADAIESAGHKYVGFVGKTAVAGSVFADLSESPGFVNLMKSIYERGTRRPAPPVDLYQVLRCLAGETGEAHSLIFHFDSYVVTALIPVEIPSSGQSGDLIMLRARRGVRKTYLANLVDKLLLDNRGSQKLLRILHKKGRLPVRRVKMVPGNAYFFWGYQTVHANEACDPQAVRATAIYHFANPHGQSKFGATVRKFIPR
jgi:hypothetical protein